MAAVREEEGLGQKGEGNKQRKNLINIDNSMLITREKGGGGGRRW